MKNLFINKKSLFTNKPIRVAIEWTDSVASSNWEYINEINSIKPRLCKTLGFIIKETKDYTIITHTISNNDATLGYLSIPRHCIRKIIRL